VKICFTLAVGLLWLMGPTTLGSQEDQPESSFARAYTLFTEGNPGQAEPLFRGILDRSSVLQDYALYFLGAIAASQHAHGTARAHFARLKKDFPRSLWLNQANLHLAKILLREGDNQGAIELLATLGVKGVDETIFNEALYLLGKTYESVGNRQLAYASYQKLRNSSPLSSWAGMAKKEVLRLREQFADPLELDQPKELLAEGEILLKEGDAGEAEKIYRRLPALVTGQSLHLPSLKGLARVYRSIRRRSDEINALERLIEHFPNEPEAAAAHYRIAELYWNQGESGKALAEFKRFQERHPGSKLRPDADIAIGRIYESLGNPQGAMRVFENFPRRFPRSDLRWEASWRLAWMHYLRADYDGAFATFARIAGDHAPDPFLAGSLFWQARCAERLGRTDEARGYYRQILRSEAESYYRGPALSALRKMGEDIARSEPEDEPQAAQPKIPFDPDLVFHLTRAQTLSELSLHRFALAELDEVRDRAGQDHALKLMLMRQYARNQGFDRAIVLAMSLNLASHELKRFRYPLAYWETIRREAGKRKLDPYLIMALIRQESLFDPEAISPASALGLMQLLPSTAKLEARNLDIQTPEPEQLFNPDLNLTLGIQHLKRLFDEFPQSMAKALAAYNAGRRPVNRWEKRFASMDEEEFIERIPYRETRYYVKLVLRNYWIYKELYDGH